MAYKTKVGLVLATRWKHEKTTKNCKDNIEQSIEIILKLQMTKHETKLKITATKHSNFDYTFTRHN